jgi:hypothetical protein
LAVPIVVQVPAPAGERWKAAEATPELGSAESDETVTVPRRTLPLPGAVREPVGEPESIRTSCEPTASSLPTAS